MKKQILMGVMIFLFMNVIHAQHETSQRIPLIGSKAPSFIAPSTKGLLSFPDDFGKDWKILFSHPRDFTPVCSSEILDLAYNQNEFKELGAHLVIVSVDRMASHENWQKDLEEIDYKGKGRVKIDFPLVADSSSVISRNYGMIDPKTSSGQSVRGVFFIDPKNEIRAFYFYPSEVGRNTDEILRTLKALQTQSQHENIVMPANWQPGDDVMIPILTGEDKEELQGPDSKIHFINWYMIYRKHE